MSNDRLNDLMVIAIEKDAGKVDLNAAVDEFAKIKVQ